MEVHIWDVPAQSTDQDLRRFFNPYIVKLPTSSRVYYHCQTARNKDTGKLTFLSWADGELFLKRHGQQRPRLKDRDKLRHHAKLHIHNRPIYCEKSKLTANPLTIRTLEKDVKDGLQNKYEIGPPVANTSFECSSLMCGTLGYLGEGLRFFNEISWNRGGSVYFKEKKLIVTLNDSLRMDCRYDSIYQITSDNSLNPALLIQLSEPPHFTQLPKQNTVMVLDDLFQMVKSLDLNNNNTGPARRGNGNEAKKRRLCGFDENHKSIAGSCLVYRLGLSEYSSGQTGMKLEALKRARSVPSIEHHSASIIQPLQSHQSGLNLLHETLGGLNNDIPWPLAFQIIKLAQNGFLSPFQVLDLLPEFSMMMERSDMSVCVAAMRRLFHRIPWAGPGTKAEDFDREAIVDLLKVCEDRAKLEAHYVADFKGTASRNTADIHRVRITPAGLYLHGPESESNNRVLRKYAGYHEYFVRVEFHDEDGDRVQYASATNNDEIFDVRFRTILQRGFYIAGRGFEYLGCSHSSLRTQSCWFVAPFVREYELHSASHIIRQLGNFAAIRSPAKCAARVGQAFSDTPNTLKIDDRVVRRIPDLERNGRVFSDGVGTMSESLMHKIWDNLPSKHRVMPTCFQIRYQGAKGMISLDSRLRGDVLCLRPSMIKFDGSISDDLEICGGAYNPLPMYLNRQFIKILEDLGVSDEFFMNLQAKEISRLRSITTNPYNASTFLRSKRVGDVVLLPALIDHISSLDLDFRSDVFLCDVLEMAVLMELRTLKYKGRIPVDKGFHLHGLMDETGILEEGQVYCCVLEDGKPKVLVGKDMIITRAPALHPGDIQLVDAVEVPADSPLKKLYNCICFSQKGARDLPSQLSGGDLDGDLYYIMWDENARLERTAPPADYPRLDPIDIRRPVGQNDMADFFLTFMKTDQLGIISNRHLVYADQSPEGTLSENCITLAELASTAVDYSKTGIPVEISKAPRNILFRPDFMAPSPHVKMEKLGEGGIQLAPNFAPIEPEDDDDEGTNLKFYETPKVLGKLYRAIDERRIFADIKNATLKGANETPDVMQHVWEFVSFRCQGIQWKHFRTAARDIQEMYENCVRDIMHDFSTHPSRPISEREVFTGNILGKASLPSKKQKELSVSMKEKYDEDAAYIIDCIIKVNSEYTEEALERSLACFAVSMEEKAMSAKRGEEVVSFKYLAAGVCLREMERVPGLLPSYY